MRVSWPGWLPIGTRSLLFGAHQILIHPWFVAAGWWHLYGMPRDYRLWIAFFLHDLGYWGAPDLDGPVGQRHPEWAGTQMARWFGPQWGAFVLLHSRYYAQLVGSTPSRLCWADKMGTALTPAWLYLLLVWLSGELAEYLALARVSGFYTGRNPWVWFRMLRDDWRQIAEGQARRPHADWGTVTAAPPGR
jgi:hypothetical protein